MAEQDDVNQNNTGKGSESNSQEGEPSSEAPNDLQNENDIWISGSEVSQQVNDNKHLDNTGSDKGKEKNMSDE